VFRIVFVAAALMFAGYGPVAAQSFDTDAHCNRIANVGGTHSNTLELSCRKREAADKDAVQQMYAPDTVREHCERIAQVGGTGSYGLLKTCITREIADKDAVQQMYASDSVRAHCEKIAKVGGTASYGLMKTCITREMKAAAELRK